MSEIDRYETFEAVPERYNFLDAKASDLDRYGIPQKPGEPQLLEFWKKLVSPPFRILKPQFNMFGVFFQTRPPNNLESSLNWSGTVVSPPRPKRIILATAGWTMPVVTHSAPPPLFIEEDAPKTLVWVGLDGHNGKLPKISLPQIGTFHTPDGPPTCTAWVSAAPQSSRICCTASSGESVSNNRRGSAASTVPLLL